MGSNEILPKAQISFHQIKKKQFISTKSNGNEKRLKIVLLHTVLLMSCTLDRRNFKAQGLLKYSLSEQTSKVLETSLLEASAVKSS